MNIINRIKKKAIREYYDQYRNPSIVKGKQKVFCIGRNKTGTTSLKKAFENLDYIVGNQRKAEKLLPDYKKNNFEPIIEYCKTARVFQDFPFSFPKTYKYLDKAFPGSKFILTVRDSPEQWYNSVTKFHAKRFGKGAIPTKEDLQNSCYIWKGWIWECNRLIYATPEDDVYNKEILIGTYNKYNDSVKSYFKNKSEKLLVINIGANDSYQELMDFLDIDSSFNDFPWENKTKNIDVK